MGVDIDVEYCGTCGYFEKYQELADFIKLNYPSPEIKLHGHEGRRASFEVKINGVLVHSKLCTLAYPDFDDLSTIIEEVADGSEVRSCKQQPITSCVIV